MAKFVTIGYGDRAGYERIDSALRDAAHAHDARLRSRGAEIGAAGTPRQVRNTEGRGVETKSGPFMTASLPVAGFAIIEAADLEEAIELVSHTPCAVAHGVVEVWPLVEKGRSER
ncbi:MAG: transcription initiation protein [Candidatus Dormibacteraeota bacterium]|nr:transcription initiation protein [Candidatus Dormibacteraeota bacterium]